VREPRIHRVVRADHHCHIRLGDRKKSGSDLIARLAALSPAFLAYVIYITVPL
jgi:hypothetical protein